MRRIWDEDGRYNQESLDLFYKTAGNELSDLYKRFVELHNVHPRDASHLMQEEIHNQEMLYMIFLKSK